MDLRCAVSLPRGIALRWMVILSSTGFTGCGNSASFHSERREESLPIENKRPRGILRANSALRMTVFRFFPQPVQPVWFELRLIESTQAEACATQDPRHRRANPSRARDISGLADYGKTHIARYSEEGSGVHSVGYYSCPFTAFCSSDSPPCSKRSSQEINSARVQSGWYL